MIVTLSDVRQCEDSFWEGNVVSKAKTQDRQIHSQNRSTPRLTGRRD